MSTNPVPAHGEGQPGGCIGRGHPAQQSPWQFWASPSLTRLPQRRISPSSERPGRQEPEKRNTGPREHPPCQGPGTLSIGVSPLPSQPFARLAAMKIKSLPFLPGCPSTEPREPGSAPPAVPARAGRAQSAPLTMAPPVLARGRQRRGKHKPSDRQSCQSGPDLSKD